jgi:hypothetical protein
VNAFLVMTGWEVAVHEARGLRPPEVNRAVGDFTYRGGRLEDAVGYYGKAMRVA